MKIEIKKNKIVKTQEKLKRGLYYAETPVGNARIIIVINDEQKEEFAVIDNEGNIQTVSDTTMWSYYKNITPIKEIKIDIVI